MKRLNRADFENWPSLAFIMRLVRINGNGMGRVHSGEALDFRLRRDRPNSNENKFLDIEFLSPIDSKIALISQTMLGRKCSEFKSRVLTSRISAI